MIIGIPKEIKTEEYRVALLPEGVKLLTRAGHRVILQKNAGKESGFFDWQYRAGGAKISNSPKEIWQADLILKVKEPQPQEYKFLKENQILFTFLHLAAFPQLIQVLKEKKVCAIDFATVEKDKKLPILQPMSEISGRLAIQIGAHFLEKKQGGEGILISGLYPIPPALVLILGGGTVGRAAAKTALSLGARVVLLEKNLNKIRALKKEFKNKVLILPSSLKNLKKILPKVDLLVGAVLIPGKKAPKLIKKEMVKKMKKGAVIVDVSIDQGGCSEFSRPTTHQNPVFEKFGVLHYCVPNIPGIIPRTSTQALSKAVFPYLFELCNLGFKKAVLKNQALARGVNVYRGKITNFALAQSLNQKFFPLKKLLDKSD